jgi:hypothetical protein
VVIRSKQSLNSNEEQMRFKKGHKKLGGRQKGTPNLVNKDLIQAVVQAAGQVGSDGKGKGGVDGYLQMLAGKKAAYFVGLLRQAVQKQVPASLKTRSYTRPSKTSGRRYLIAVYTRHCCRRPRAILTKNHLPI